MKNEKLYKKKLWTKNTILRKIKWNPKKNQVKEIKLFKSKINKQKKKKWYVSNMSQIKAVDYQRKSNVSK